MGVSGVLQVRVKKQHAADPHLPQIEGHVAAGKEHVPLFEDASGDHVIYHRLVHMLEHAQQLPPLHLIDLGHATDRLESAEVDILVDLEAEGGQGGAGAVANRRVATVQGAEVGADQPDRTSVAGADGLEPAAEQDAVVDLDADGVQGGAAVVAYRRLLASQHAEVGAVEQDRAVLAVGCDHSSIEN
jgi:hypothetical protein